MINVIRKCENALNVLRYFLVRVSERERTNKKNFH